MTVVNFYEVYDFLSSDEDVLSFLSLPILSIKNFLENLETEKT